MKKTKFSISAILIVAIAMSLFNAGITQAKGGKGNGGNVCKPNKHRQCVVEPIGQPLFTQLPVGGTLSNGTVDLLKFKIDANNHDIDLTKATFKVQAVGVTISNLELLDITNYLENPLFSQAVYITDSATVDAVFTSPVTVALNMPRYFVLRGVVTGANSGDAIVTMTTGDAAAAQTLPGTLQDVLNDVNNNFVWSDRSAVAHSTETADWFNGFQVAGLPAGNGPASILAL